MSKSFNRNLLEATKNSNNPDLVQNLSQENPSNVQNTDSTKSNLIKNKISKSTVPKVSKTLGISKRSSASVKKNLDV